MLKTHADIIEDWSERTVRRLQEISRQKGFLLFEDRKFGDIGSTSPLHAQFPVPDPPFPSNPHPPTKESKHTPPANAPIPDTVQKQYTSGVHRICTWATLVNAHLFPGPTIITALQEAATSTLAALNQCVLTEITAGTPRSSSDMDDSDLELDDPFLSTGNDADGKRADGYNSTGRKRSIVTATTISQYTEHTHAPSPLIPRSVPDDSDEDEASSRMAALGQPPVARGLLLLAEMSSEGNMLTAEYTRACVDAARLHGDFVIGFIAQRGLSSEVEDNFITFTPGVSLPPADGKKEGKMGDALGQRYNTPRKVVLEEGCDVVIVGRGILGARDRKKEAERYRMEAWAAYEERIAGSKA